MEDSTVHGLVFWVQIKASSNAAEGLVQWLQNPGARWPHRVESSIDLGVAGIGLNGIPTVNDLPVFYKHGIGSRMPVILETNTSHPRPTLERVYPTKSRYCECVVGRAIFEEPFEVIGDEVVVARIRSGPRHLRGRSGVMNCTEAASGLCPFLL
jgi:hypothetical protein